MIDAILISSALTQELKDVTQNAVSTIGENVNTLVVESNPSADYFAANVLHVDGEFNYNRLLNAGARRGSQEYIFFGNNDLQFERNWEVELIKAMNDFNVRSASPLCPESLSRVGIRYNTGVFFGHQVFERFAGWAFMWTRKMYEQLGGLNEDYSFWCSDNAAIEQLKNAGENHALVTSSVVRHLNGGSNTIDLAEGELTYKYTIAELHKFNKQYGTDLHVTEEWKTPKHLKRFV